MHVCVCVCVRVCACVSSLRASSPRTGSTLGSDDNASDDWNRAGTALIIRPVVMLPPIPNMSSSSTPTASTCPEPLPEPLPCRDASAATRGVGGTEGAEGCGSPQSAGVGAALAAQRAPLGRRTACISTALNCVASSSVVCMKVRRRARRWYTYLYASRCACVRAQTYAQTHACMQANSWICTHQPNIAALTPRKEHTNRATAQPGKRDDAGVLLLRESAAGGWTLTPVWELTCTQPQQQSIHCSWCPIEKAGPSLLTPL